MNFNLDSTEEQSAKEFMKKHENCYLTSTIGGKFTFIITPTGLGPIVSIRCNVCNEEKDITNCNNW